MSEFEMTCPFRGGKCSSDCALLLESNYGHGFGSRIESEGFYVCAIAKIAVSTMDEHGLFVSNYA